ncbi:DUF1778 domain-containing protein [Mesorhizobium caraganae]|uniref:type II toxin -antitoxin system TacA 1-like antitoxin n=1 Tax=Mesorhizobium caraganae TaxID=483206 RepID=UPI001785766D|nr:DUF1778 domain-containing protein [Mesorhizobium caraganae]MBM2713233.1 DUF1778 domain-containing protein [Mesorhizobium caraganae]
MPNRQTHAHSEAAHETEQCIIQLSIEDQLALATAIVDPPEPNEALRKALDTHKRLVRESR